MDPLVYLAVHGGAGNHGRKSEKDTKDGLRQACAQAISSLRQQSGISALSVIEGAISSLEDNPQFNAGYGSNLTLDGNVECDASIMDGRTGDYGGVGAVSGVKHPISLARRVLAHARIPDKLGRLPPMVLVSDGARKFAAADTNITQPDELIASRARDEWKSWKSRLGSSSGPNDQLTGLHDLQDTVGAVTWVEGDGTAAGVSSGGLLLKYPGRVGEATIYGAGCWAQTGLACSVSGAGEHIIRASLARSIGEMIMASDDVDPHDVIYHALIDRFWNPSRVRGEPYPSAGLILLTKDEESSSARLWCAFSTPSMAIAYASTIHPVPKVVILRRPLELENQSNDKPRIFVTAVTL